MLLALLLVPAVAGWVALPRRCISWGSSGRGGLDLLEADALLAPPTLLLTGEHDVPDFRLIADLIAGSAPDVRRIDYPERGHMLTLEAPAECAKAIGAFLQGQ